MTGADATTSQVVCLITTPSGRARDIAEAIVKRRLAACINIVPLVESIYWWQGKIEEDAEALLVIKTTSAAVTPLTVFVREIHPYDNFELVSVEIQSGSLPYLDWIVGSVKVSSAS